MGAEFENFAADTNAEMCELYERDGGELGLATLTHHWINPAGKQKTTNYEINFAALTQTNPDSGRTREIRLIRQQVLRPLQSDAFGSQPRGARLRDVLGEHGMPEL